MEHSTPFGTARVRPALAPRSAPGALRPGLWALALLVLLPATVLHAQTGEELARRLRDNVVKITTERVGGSAGPTGFGFIVGESGAQVYLVTAAHVVLAEGPGQEIGKRYVTFFLQQARRDEAEFLGRYPGRDLALMRVGSPGDLTWERNAMAPPDSVRRGKQVWFIGRSGEWYVPTGPNVGTVNRKRADIIDVDIGSVRPGTSGTPFITEDGIIGMVLRDDDAVTASALSIDFIKSAFDEFNEWEPHPWSLNVLGEGPLPFTRLSVRSSPDGATVRLDGAHVGTTPLDTMLTAGRPYTLVLESDGRVPVLGSLFASPGDSVLVYNLVPYDTLSVGENVRLTHIQFKLRDSDPSVVDIQYDLNGEQGKKYKVDVILVDEFGNEVEAELGERKCNVKGVETGEGNALCWRPVHPFPNEVAAVRLTVKRQRGIPAYVLAAVGGGALVTAAIVLLNGNVVKDGFPLPPTRPGGQ